MGKQQKWRNFSIITQDQKKTDHHNLNTGYQFSQTLSNGSYYKIKITTWIISEFSKN